MVDLESPPTPEQLPPTSTKTGKTKIVPEGKPQQNCEAWSENESEKKIIEENNENENEPFIKEKEKNNVKIFAIKVVNEKRKTGSSQLKSKAAKKKSARLKLLQICKCCPWYVPWISLIISSIQVGF